ncbi:MAG: hypothetical protein Q7S17_07960 [Xanthobacteraceae bacterium]|nr:hypothetical protein [Xanthobacteraceae bacterium]
MRRISVLLLLFAALGAGAAFVMPQAGRALALRFAADEPGQLADLRLAAAFDADVAAREIAAALEMDDIELAESFLALAEQRGIGLPEDFRAKIAAARSTRQEVVRAVSRFGRGLVTGEADNIAGLAGAATGDLLVFGDLRDLAREGSRWARGAEADKLMLGLAAAGLMVTAGTYASAGEAAPLRAGVSLVKAARRAGKVGLSLAADFGRALRAGQSGRVALAVADMGRIEAKAGARTALEGLRHADELSDLSRVSRLVETKGRSSLAVLKTLGRGALVLGAGAVTAALWVLGAASNIFLLLLTLGMIFAWFIRRLWPVSRYAWVKIAAMASPNPAIQVMTVSRTVHAKLHP